MLASHEGNSPHRHIPHKHVEQHSRKYDQRRSSFDKRDKEFRNFSTHERTIHEKLSGFHDLPLKDQLNTIQDLFLIFIDDANRSKALQYAAQGAEALEALKPTNIDVIAEQQGRAQQEQRLRDREEKRRRKLEKAETLRQMLLSGKPLLGFDISTMREDITTEQDIKSSARRLAHQQTMAHLIGAWPIDTDDPAIAIPLETLSESIANIATLIPWPREVSGLPSTLTSADINLQKAAEMKKGQPLTNQELYDLAEQNPGKILTPEQWKNVEGLGPKALLLRLLNLQIQQTPFKSFHFHTDTSEITPKQAAILQVLGSALIDSWDFNQTYSVEDVDRKLAAGIQLNAEKLTARNQAIIQIPLEYVENLVGVSGFLDQARKSLGTKQAVDEIVYTPSEAFLESPENAALEAWSRDINQTFHELDNDSVSNWDMDALKKRLVTLWLHEVPGRTAGELLPNEPRLFQMLTQAPLSGAQAKATELPFEQLMDELGRVIGERSSYPADIQNMVHFIFFQHTTTHENVEQETDPEYRNIRDKIIDMHGRMLDTVLFGKNQQDLDAVKRLAESMGTEDFVQKMSNLVLQRMLFAPESGSTRAPEYQLNRYLYDGVYLLEHRYPADAALWQMYRGRAADVGFSLIYAGTRFYVLEELWKKIGQIVGSPEKVQEIANGTREFLDREQTQKGKKEKEEPHIETTEKTLLRPFDRILVPKSEQLQRIINYMGSEFLQNIFRNKGEYMKKMQQAWNQILGTNQELLEEEGIVPGITYAPYADPGFRLVHHVNLQKLPGVPNNEFSRFGVTGAGMYLIETTLPPENEQTERKSFASITILTLGDPQRPITVMGILKDGKVDVFLPLEDVAEDSDPESVRYSEREGMRIMFQRLIMNLTHGILVRAEYREEIENAEKETEKALTPSPTYTSPAPIGLNRYRMIPLGGLASEHTVKGKEKQQQAKGYKYAAPTWINFYQRPLPGAREFRLTCDEWKRASRKIAKYTSGSIEMELLKQNLEEIEGRIISTWEQLHMPTIENLEDKPVEMVLERRRIPIDQARLLELMAAKYSDADIQEWLRLTDIEDQGMLTIKGRRGGERRLKQFLGLGPYIATPVHGHQRGGNKEAGALLAQNIKVEAPFAQDESQNVKRYKVGPIGISLLLELNAELSLARQKTRVKDNQLVIEDEEVDEDGERN